MIHVQIKLNIVKYITNVMCYIMLYILEWIRKEKNRIGISRI